MSLFPLLPMDAAPSPVPLVRSGGFGALRLDRRIRSREVLRVIRGVYTPTDAWMRLRPWERYLARVHATSLLIPDAVFSHESAAALLGLPIIGEPDQVHILREITATSRGIHEVRVHTTSDARDVVDLGGSLATAPIDTAIDMARSRHPALALAVADAVLRTDTTSSAAELRARNERRASPRGRRIARWPLTRADARGETPLESISRAVVEWLGFAVPDLQVTVPTTAGERRLDMYWPGPRVAGEADGRVKYSGAFGTPDAVLFEEKRREDALRRQVAGLARWGWDELRDPMALRRILIQAGLTPLRPPATSELFSLRAALARR